MPDSNSANVMAGVTFTLLGTKLTAGFKKTADEERTFIYQDVTAGNDNAHQSFCEELEEGTEPQPVGIAENCETRQGRALAAVERRGNSPHAPLAVLQLLKLVIRVFQQSVGRIGDDSLDGVFGNELQPFEGVAVIDPIRSRIVPGPDRGPYQAELVRERPGRPAPSGA